MTNYSLLGTLKIVNIFVCSVMKVNAFLMKCCCKWLAFWVLSHTSFFKCCTLGTLQNKMTRLFEETKHKLMKCKKNR